MKAPSCCLVSHTLQEGVGPADANRLLAAELAKRGYRVSLCGLNDSSTSAVRAEEMDICGVSLPTLHIPRAMGWRERCEVFGRFLEEQQPGHVIVRFIPYSLNPKGIVWTAANTLPKVLQGRAVFFLMDELWLGEGPTTLKHWLVGALQRISILRMLKGVRPRRIYTNNRSNTKVLRRRGVEAETLRLFGNIPVAAGDGGEWLFGEFETAGIPITPANRNQWLVLGNFGIFHPDWKSGPFFSSLKKRAAAHGKQVCVVGIGGLGACKDHWQEVAGTWGGEFRFLHLGRRDAGEVSRFLQSVDFGITTTPYFLVGKSGTCMAMLDHGLPIIAPRIAADDDPTEFPEQLVLRTGDEPGDAIFAPRGRSVPDPQLPRAATELISAMSADR